MAKYRSIWERECESQKVRNSIASSSGTARRLLIAYMHLGLLYEHFFFLNKEDEVYLVEVI